MDDAVARPRGRWPALALVTVLLLASVLRVGWPTLSEFKFSEARLEALALELTREGRIPLVGVPSSAGFDHSPVSVYLYVPAFLFTTSPIPATLYGGLMGVAAVALCWWLARRWPGGGVAAAVVAASMLAVNPWSVSFSRKIWQVSFVPVLTLTVVGLAVASLGREDLTLEPRARGWRLALMVLAYAVLVQVHPSAVSLAPALVLWLALFGRRVMPAYLVLGGCLGLLTGLPMLIHQAQSGWPAWKALLGLPAAEWDLSALRLGWEMITGRGIHALAGDAVPVLGSLPKVTWVFHLVGWITVASGLVLLVRMIRNWRGRDPIERSSARVDLILLSWLGIGVLFNLRHSLELHLHFFALLAPGAFVVAGRGIQAGLQDVWPIAAGVRVAAKTRSILIFCAGGILAVILILQVISLVSLALFLSENSVSGGFGTPLREYLGISRQAIEAAHDAAATELVVVGVGDSVVVHEQPAIFDVLLRDRVAYRFVDGAAAALFPLHRTAVLLAPDAGEAVRWYDSWTQVDAADGYRLLTLEGSWPTDKMIPVHGPRLAESGIELQAFLWEPEPAGRAELWLLWQVLWVQQEDTHFFVHIRDEQERLLGQADASGYPNAYRRKGDRIVSRFNVRLGEPQDLSGVSAQVGLYFYPQVRSIGILDGAGNVVGDAITLDLSQGVE